MEVCRGFGGLDDEEVDACTSLEPCCDRPCEVKGADNGGTPDGPAPLATAVLVLIEGRVRVRSEVRCGWTTCSAFPVVSAFPTRLELGCGEGRLFGGEGRARRFVGEEGSVGTWGGEGVVGLDSALWEDTVLVGIAGGRIVDFAESSSPFPRYYG